MKYPVSQDYSQLWELARLGHQIACCLDLYTGPIARYVDSSGKGLRDVARAKASGKGVIVVSNGHVYFETDSPTLFVAHCQDRRLRWIVGEVSGSPDGAIDYRMESSLNEGVIEGPSLSDVV